VSGQFVPVPQAVRPREAGMTSLQPEAKAGRGKARPGAHASAIYGSI